MRAKAVRADHGVGGGGKTKQERPEFFSGERIRENIAAVMGHVDFWLTPAYSLAIQAEHLLQVVEGGRVHVERTPEKRIRWTDEKRLELLRDPRSAAELAGVHGVSSKAIHAQRVLARKLAA